MSARRRLQPGVTVVEALVTLAIVVIVLALSTPMGHLVRDVKLTLAANGLAAAVRFTRARAVFAHEAVTLCAGDAAGCDAAGDWARGCVAFVDADRDGQPGAGEAVLRVWALPRGPAVQATAAAVVFTADGSAATARWSVCWPGRPEHRHRGLWLLPAGALYPLEPDTCAL